MKKRVFAMLLACALVVGLVPVRAKASGMGKVGQGQTVANSAYSLVIKEDDSLWVWGWNRHGQLGDGTTENRHTPVKVMDNVASVSAGGNHSLAIKTDGTLWVCGENESGQLGDGTTEERHIPVKVMDNVAAVSAGDDHSLAIKTDGTLWAWGKNDYGQLGDGTTENRYIPVKVMDNAAAVSAGADHSLAIKTDGTLWAWGMNWVGQLGDGTTEEHHSPVKVMDNVVAVGGGDWYSFAIKTDNTLWGWGWNRCGTLGDGTTEDRYTPVKVMDNVAAVDGERYSSLAIQTDGTLWVWGMNPDGLLGDGTTEDRYTPVKVMDNVVIASKEGEYSLAIQVDGTLWTWGYSGDGRLGDGTTEDRSTPVKIMDNVKLPGGTSGITQTTLKDNSITGLPQTVPSSWAEDEVNSARDNGLIPESLDGNYTGNITRAEFCRLGVALVKGLGKEDQVFSKKTVVLNGKRFTDTDDADVLAMCDAGIVNGYGDGRFGPDDPITREQAAVMLARLARAVGKNEADIKNTGFRDGDKISSWAKEDVQFIAGVRTQGGKAVMGGTGGGNFSPKNNYTREQAFVTFERLNQAILYPYVKAGADASLPDKPDLERGEQDMAQRAVELVQKLGKLIENEEKEPFRDKDAELEKLKASVVAQGMEKDDIPNEVYQAFAVAVYDALEASNIDELESDPVKLTNQIYDAIKGGLQSGEQTIKVGNTQYKVSFQIMAASFLGIGAQASFATVTWTDSKGSHQVHLSSTGSHEDMKKALAAYCTALAKLNTEVWKDFLAAYFADAFGLMKIDVKSKDVKNALDTAEKVINALNDRNEAKKLVEECFKDTNQAFRDQLLGKWFKNPLANEFVDYIEKALPQGKTIKAGAKCYEKVQKTFEKWREADYAGKDGATLSELYEAFNDAITDLDKLLEEMG